MFSAKERLNIVTELGETNFDIAIIGGGMTGAGIALDAASRGLKTALIEKEDFAWGTSSRSTKLIHGGLRYLKQLQFKIVKEVGLERAIVYNNALHIVRPVKMLLPIVKGGSLGSIGTRIGLSMYDRLAEVAKHEKKKILSKEKALDQEPLLESTRLKGAGLYVEYRTDDSRLVIENIKKAEHIGALALNYLEAKNFERLPTGHQSIAVSDIKTGNQFNITSKVVVNAAGPWVDQVRALENERAEKKLFLSKGVHIVIRRERFPLENPVYFDVANDSRMIFAIPRDGIVYIGPTDTAFNQNIDDPLPDLQDVQYILDATNSMFPNLGLNIDDVNSTWTGLRPLIFEEGKSPSEMSRKDEVFVHPSGIISIAGGKLTGYRKMAEKIVNLAVEKLGTDFNIAKRYPKCFTHEIKVSGSEFKNEKELIAYHKHLIRETRSIDIPENWINYLVYNYGSNTDVIIGRYNSEKNPHLSPLEKIIMAEVWYGVDHEMVTGIKDFYIRRTGRLYFNRDFTLEHLDWTLECLSKELGWTAKQKTMEKAQYLAEANKVLQFKNVIKETT